MISMRSCGRGRLAVGRKLWSAFVRSLKDLLQDVRAGGVGEKGFAYGADAMLATFEPGLSHLISSLKLLLNSGG